MLSAADADLVRRDTALPGLATLLDPEAFLALWRRLHGPDSASSVTPVYLRYKPRTNCLVSYRVETPRGPRVIYAKTHGVDVESKLSKAALRSEATVVPELGLSLYAFPDDAQLRSLARLRDPAQGRALLARILSRPEVELEGAVLETLAYKPERRFVTRCALPGGPSVVVKFYTQAGFRAARKASHKFGSGRVLHVLRRLDESKRHRALAFEWLPGTMLRDQLGRPSLDSEMLGGVGAALAELHAQPVKRLPQRDLARRLRSLTELGENLAFLVPSLAERTGALVAALAQGLSENDATPCATHGDLHDKQILLDGERVSLIDLDQAAIGDPRRDLALLFAHLERDALVGTLGAERARAVREAVVLGYEKAGGRVAAPLDLHVAEALVGLAHHPFRRREPEWAARTTAIVERAETLVSSAS